LSTENDFGLIIILGGAKRLKYENNFLTSKEMGPKVKNR
jgi:hypothetical protein